MDGTSSISSVLFTTKNYLGRVCSEEILSLQYDSTSTLQAVRTYVKDGNCFFSTENIELSFPQKGNLKNRLLALQPEEQEDFFSHNFAIRLVQFEDEHFKPIFDLRVLGGGGKASKSAAPKVGPSSLGIKDDAQNGLKRHSQELEEEKIDQSDTNIGVTGKSAWQYTKSPESRQKALKLRQKTYSKIGKDLHGLKRYQEALEAHQKELELRQKTYGEIHFNVVSSYSKIGKDLYALGRYQESVEAHQKALELFGKISGENDSDVGYSYEHIGRSFRQLRQHQEALKAHRKALELCDKIHGKSPSRLAISHNNVGDSLYDLKEYQEALEFYQKALAFDRKAYGEIHPCIASDYIGIGNCFYKLERYHGAIAQYKKALEIGQKLNAEMDSSLPRIYARISSCFEALKCPKEAQEYREMAEKIQAHL